METEPVALYLICFGNMIKAGISGDPFRRLATLQTACPEPLSIIYLAYYSSRQIALRVEASVHKRMRDRRREGEWFCVDREEAIAHAGRASDQILYHGRKPPTLSFDSYEAAMAYFGESTEVTPQ